MKNLKIFLVALFGLSILSCTRKDENVGCEKHSQFIMQRVRLFDKADKWIKDIEDAKIELIAYNADWESPLLDEKGNIVKQIPYSIESKKKISGKSVQWIELYMESTKHWREKPGVVPNLESHFILKVNNDSFKIRSGYILDFCRRNILKSFFFDGKQYPAGTPWTADVVNITVS